MAKILVVDDRAENRQYLVKLLSYSGHAVPEAADGAQALEMIHADPPDLVISDILMPTMDGFEFVRQLRLDPVLAAIPVVFYSATYHQGQVEKLAEACGVRHILYKPTGPAEVLRTVASALGERQAAPPPPAEEFYPERHNLLVGKYRGKVEVLANRLAGMIEHTLQIATEREPRRVMEALARTARELVGAKYAVVGVFKPDERTIAGVVSWGLDEELARVVAAAPPQDGPLAAVLAERRSCRLNDLKGPPQDLGFPPRFPPIHSLLAIPIASLVRSYGWLCLVNKLGDEAFDEDDERLATMLAAQAGRIYENGRLYADVVKHLADLDLEIAERKRAEQDLRLQTTALEAAANGVVITDPNGHVLWVNPAFTRMAGYAFAEVRGQNLRLLKSGKHDSAFYRDLWQTIQSGTPWSGEMTNRRKDGSTYIEEQTITPVCGADGRISHFIAIKQDVTEKKSVEETLRERSRQAALSANVGIALTSGKSLPEMLQRCAESMVQHLDAAFARIWLLNTDTNVLELQASAGLYTHRDGPHSRVPVGSLKIGLIAQERRPHLTNDVLHDPRVSDPEWARREGMVSFAGYPLLVADRLVGVMALFARTELPDAALDVMAAVANKLALGIERKHAEENLERAQRRLHHLISASPVVLYALQPEGEFYTATWVSENMARMTGFAAAETLGFEWWATHLHPEDRAQAMASLKTLEAQDECDEEYRILCKNGEYRWFLANQRLIRDNEGKPIEVIGSWTDINDRKQSETALRESEERLRQITENSREALWLTNADASEVLYVSPAYEKIWGRTCANLYQAPHSWLDAVHPDDRAQAQEFFTKSLEEEAVSREYRIVRPDGSVRRILGRTFVIRNERGEKYRRAGVSADVTERYVLEEQYRQAQKMEAVGKLAGGVAHDFNNLLTVINGYSAMLLGNLHKEDPLHEVLEQINKAGERAAGLTRQLLAFSRKQVLRPEILDINSIISDMEKMLRRLIGEDIDLKTAPDPYLGQVKADAGQIEQVIMNIAINARDAMPKGGKLTIETHNADLDSTYAERHAGVQPGRYVLLAISDTGCGMDVAVKSRIFEPFFSTKGERGTGLGLATVYGIVKQTGGHVEVYSEPGQGTTFKVYLPREAGSEPGRRSSVVLAPSLMGKETILLVEDDEGVRKLASVVLQGKGYTVLTARNGGEALSLCEHHPDPIHLVISDVVMPGMSGPQIAERLLKVRPKMKVLYCSGYTDDAVVHHGVLGPDTPFLHKPFTPDALARKVREVLDQS